MSLRSQANALATQGAAFRQEISGSPFTYDGKSYCGSFSAITTTRDQERGGWHADVNCTVRVARCAYPGFIPVDGKPLTLTETGVSYRITEIRDNPRAPEWVIGLSALEA
ncbi:MAG: hypothetical protein K0R17_1012 [Rariglobus sp.]|jgi:hypothetical protein|nr:hypothetical protein [Rariglobus sp.]